MLQRSVCTFLVRITESRVRASEVWVNKLSANDSWCEPNRRKKMWQPVGRSVDGVHGGSDSGKHQWRVTLGCRHNLVTPRPGRHQRDKRPLLTHTHRQQLIVFFVIDLPFNVYPSQIRPRCRHRSGSAQGWPCSTNPRGTAHRTFFSRGGGKGI